MALQTPKYETCIDVVTSNNIATLISRHKLEFQRQCTADGIEEYFDKWLKILQSTLHLSEKEETLYTPQCFTQPLDLGEFSINFHFDIAKLDIISKAKKIKKYSISKLAFEHKLKMSVIENLKGYSFSSKPIFIVPFFTDDFASLLVDGNHRLSYALAQRWKEINCISFSEQEAAEALTNIFHKVTYCYFLEIKQIFHSISDISDLSKYLAADTFLPFPNTPNGASCKL